MDSRTIVAPMTPAGVSAVAAIRVSGPQVRDVVLALFGERAVARLESHKARLGTARDPKTGETVDSLLYLFFEGPNSYTGEDTLELYPHGNPLIVRELIQAIRKVQGVRLAEPGEFTRRAFLNGKMDLVQAESVADVIHSANRAELKNAHRLLSGTLSKKIQELNEQVKDMSARLELDVDFAEEEADPDYDSWRKRIVAIGEKISEILQSFRGKENLSRLPLVVLYGAPNAGKSSLVNALLGEDRILVSSVPGTTRDFVDVRLFLPGGEIRLVDTAGIADRATDELDALSMDKSREILKEADLKIHVVDGCEFGVRNSEFGVGNQKSTTDSDVTVISKCDLLDERTACGLQTRDEDFQGSPSLLQDRRGPCRTQAEDGCRPVYRRSQPRRHLDYQRAGTGLPRRSLRRGETSPGPAAETARRRTSRLRDAAGAPLPPECGGRNFF